METDGEGVGGEADRRGRSELGRLLEAIESSEVLEKRIPLIKQLEGSSHFSADGLGAILECLLASWVDSTCSGVSHCTLHRSILQVALKCTDMDITDYLGQFLTLGAKASSWCGKHLLWSVGCIDESEHDGLHLEINSLSLSISTKLLGVAAKYFTVLGLEVAAGGGGKGAAEEEEELEWLSNKDAFPSVEAVAVEVEEASASPLDAPRASTKGRRRVTANESSRQAKEMAMPPVRRCTHCATEETPQWRWREGPDGPRTLCNACGLVFKKKGRLLPEYRPAKSSASSPLLHSSTHRHRRAFEMHHQNETTSAACHGEARSELVEGQLLPPPNGPASSYRLQRHCPLRHQNEVDTSAAGRAIVEAGRGEARLRLESMEVQLRPERPPAFSQLQRHSPHRQERRQSEETSAVDRATTETRRGESRFESMEVQPLPERPPAYIPAFSLVPHRFVLKRRRQSEEEETSAAGRDTVEARRGEARLRLESMEVQLRRERPPAFSQLQRYSPLHQERRQSEETSAVDRATTEARRDEARFESMEVQPLPERPPAYSPAFSLVPHRFVLKRRRKSEEEETSAAGRATAEARLRLESMEVQLRPERPPAFSQLQHYSPLRQERRQREEETSATGHATTEARRGEESVKAQLLPERPPAYSSAFSLVPHRLVPKRHHQSEEETFAVIHATAKALRAERAAAMDD